MQISEERIPVFLTKEQAALFVLFQGVYDAFGFMMQEGVFDIHRGSATLNFDRGGKLTSIKKELFSYTSDPVDNAV